MKELWDLEHSFWTGGPETYETHLAPDSLMILPPPAGVLGRVATINSIRSSARWASVTFSDKHLIRANDSSAVLVYVALADRGDPDSIYSAQCSSTYVRSGQRWQLASHQQTPLGVGNGGRA